MKHDPTEEDRELNIFSEGLEAAVGGGEAERADAAEVRAPAAPELPMEEDEDVRIYRPRRSTRAETATWEETLTDTTFYADETPEQSARYYEEDVREPDEELPQEPRQERGTQKRGFFASLFGSLRRDRRGDADGEGYVRDSVAYDDGEDEPIYAETEEIPEDIYDGNYEEETSVEDRQAIEEILDDFWKNFQDPAIDAEPIAVETPEDEEAYSRAGEMRSPVEDVFDELSRLRGKETGDAEESAEELPLTVEEELSEEETEPEREEVEIPLEEPAAPRTAERPAAEEAEELKAVFEEESAEELGEEPAEEQPEEAAAPSVFDVLHEFAAGEEPELPVVKTPEQEEPAESAGEELPAAPANGQETETEPVEEHTASVEPEAALPRIPKGMGILDALAIISAAPEAERAEAQTADENKVRGFVWRAEEKLASEAEAEREEIAFAWEEAESEPVEAAEPETERGESAFAWEEAESEAVEATEPETEREESAFAWEEAESEPVEAAEPEAERSETGFFWRAEDQYAVKAVEEDEPKEVSGLLEDDEPVDFVFEEEPEELAEESATTDSIAEESQAEYASAEEVAEDSLVEYADAEEAAEEIPEEPAAAEEAAEEIPEEPAIAEETEQESEAPAFSLEDILAEFADWDIEPMAEETPAAEFRGVAEAESKEPAQDAVGMTAEEPAEESTEADEEAMEEQQKDWKQALARAFSGIAAAFRSLRGEQNTDAGEAAAEAAVESGAAAASAAAAAHAAEENEEGGIAAEFFEEEPASETESETKPTEETADGIEVEIYEEEPAEEIEPETEPAEESADGIEVEIFEEEPVEEIEPETEPAEESTDGIKVEIYEEEPVEEIEPETEAAEESAEEIEAEIFEEEPTEEIEPADEPADEIEVEFFEEEPADEAEPEDDSAFLAAVTAMTGLAGRGAAAPASEEIEEETAYSVKEILAEHSSWLSTDALPEEESAEEEATAEEIPAEKQFTAEEELPVEEELAAEEPAGEEAPQEAEAEPETDTEEESFSVKDILSDFHSWWKSEEEPAAPELETEKEPEVEETLPVEELPESGEEQSAGEGPAEEEALPVEAEAEPETAAEEESFSVRDILSEFHSWWESEEEPAASEKETEKLTPAEEPPAEDLPEYGEELPVEEESAEEEIPPASWYRQSEPAEPEAAEPEAAEPAYKINDILADFHNWWEPDASGESPEEPAEAVRESITEEAPSDSAAEPEAEAEPEELTEEQSAAGVHVPPQDEDDVFRAEPEEPAFRVDEILEDVRSWGDWAEETRPEEPVEEEEPAASEEEPEEEPVQQIAQEPAKETEAPEKQLNTPDERQEQDFDVDAILNEYRAFWDTGTEEESEEEPEEEPEKEPEKEPEREAYSPAAFAYTADSRDEDDEKETREEQPAPASSGDGESLSALLASLWEDEESEKRPTSPAPKAAKTAAAAATVGAASYAAASAAHTAAVTASSAAVGGISRMEEEARRLMAGIELDGEDDEEDLPAREEPFHIGPTRPTQYTFGGQTVDVSSDEQYDPSGASRVREETEENEAETVSVEMEEEPDNPLFRLLRRKKRPAPPAPAGERERTQEIQDAEGERYAPDRDYAAEEQLEQEAFPSFGQYLLGLVSGLLVRLRGVNPNAGTATVSADNEDLGPEVAPAAASRYYGNFIRSLRLRFLIGAVLLAILTWITIGLPVSGALRSVRIAAGMALGIQLTIMLLSLDVITGAAVNLARGRFGADSLAVLSCILTSFDALVVLLGGFGTPHMPLCLISSLSMLGVLFSSLLSARSLRKATRVPAIGKRCYAVTGETNLKGKGITLLKSLRPAKGFVRRAEEAVPDEMLFNRVSLLFVAVALILSVVVAIAQKAGSELLYISSAILAPAAPLTALLCFALPYFVGTMRIFPSGAAIAGWSGLSDIGQSQNLIITDRDIFPEGSVSIDSVRIFADIPPEKVISYAGTMISASGSCLSPCFADLMSRNGGMMYPVENFEYLSGGGMKGIIGGEVVLCGSVELMRLMNVRVPYRLVGKTTVLLAVDGLLYGIFNMKYEPQKQVRDALVGLIRSNRHPVFAIRDFNVTPELLRSIFSVSTDGYDFPPYVERFAISEARISDDSKIAAVVCREGLGPLVHMADTGRSMYMATRINLLVTLLSAVIGVILVFVRLLTVGTIGAGFLLLYMLVWALPVFVVSFLLRF